MCHRHVARPAADCTQTGHFLRMHIARIFSPTSVAEVTGISAGSHGLLEACGESTQVHGVGIFGRESGASAKDRDLIRLLSRNKS